jgi:peptidoglycan/xylan/chitin deacetylase (PgdA/CDA1 family)
MKRLLPVMLTAAMALTACAPAKVSGSTPKPTPAPATPAQPTAEAPKPDPTPTPAPAPAPVETKPAIRWLPRGIGLPLASDDPAAKGKKVVMLTFDDGPSGAGSTAKILDVLKAENVKVMFFITGYGAKNIDLVEREYKEGHLLANHTLTHADLSTLTVEEMRKELDPVNAVIEKVTGQKPKYMRPPYGMYNKQVQALVRDEYHQELINWDDGSLDWDGVKNGWKDPKLVVDEVMKQLHPGAVVLMHDTNKHTAEALPEIIHQIRAEGYEFVVLPN